MFSCLQDRACHHYARRARSFLFHTAHCYDLGFPVIRFTEPKSVVWSSQRALKREFPEASPAPAVPLTQAWRNSRPFPLWAVPLCRAIHRDPTPQSLSASKSLEIISAFAEGSLSNQ